MEYSTTLLDILAKENTEAELFGNASKNIAMRFFHLIYCNILTLLKNDRLIDLKIMLPIK